MQFLEFFNRLAVIADPGLAKRNLPASLDQKLSDTDVDSLNRVLVSVYLCEIYGIAEEVGKTMPLETVAGILEFVDKHKQKTPESLEKALEELQ